MTVIDVTDATFETEVVERSRTLPVVVDFWAEWCGPCRMLTPVLERAAAIRECDVVLAKLDTDANQRTAASFRIQGIPAVKAFKDGRVVSEFVGAQPPQNVERFFDALVPSEAERLVAAGDEASLRRALELEPTRADAAVPLARILLERGEREEALRLVERAPGNFQAQGLAARIRLEDRGEPDLSRAWQALDAGDREGAIDALIEALPSVGTQEPAEGARNGSGAKDDIRQAVVAILDELGVDHPVARDARRRLAAALF
jgi:putative thioredoxin